MELDDTIIQVKGGLSKGLTLQITRTAPGTSKKYWGLLQI